MLPIPKLVPGGTHWLRIPRSKTAAMRVLLETVQRGSTYHTSGTVKLGKAMGFADKVARLYAADANTNRRAYRKRTGQANTTLIMFPADAPGELHWWLLATPGRGAVHLAEKLADATVRGQHLRWAQQYELLQLGYHHGQAAARSWTWRLTRSNMDEWCAQAEEATRSTGRVANDIARALGVYEAMTRMVPFRGVRRQLWELHNVMRVNWERHHRVQCPLPAFSVHYLDKSFLCYHRPNPLRLDVLIHLLQRRADALGVEAARDLFDGSAIAAPQDSSPLCLPHQFSAGHGVYTA